MNDPEAEVVREEPAPTSLAEFLEGTAPGNPRDVADLAEERHHRDHGFIGYCFVAPDIQLHCGSDSCSATMFFRRREPGLRLPPNAWHFFYITYRCSNCLATEKTFALAAPRPLQLSESDTTRSAGTGCGRCVCRGGPAPAVRPSPPAARPAGERRS